MRLQRVPTVFSAVLLVSSCATYHAQPLHVAVPMSMDVIARDAAAIRRPFLVPVTIRLDVPLDANAVATIAVAANPDLKALRARAGVADAQAFAAGLLPDPTIGIGVDKVLKGPDMFANLAGSIGVSLAALRSRSAVLARARASARQVRLDLAWAEWQTAGQARLQAVRIVSLGQVVLTQRATRDASAALFKVSLRAAARGDLSADQVQAARLAAFDAIDRLHVAERDLGVARFELARLLGLSTETVIPLAQQRFDAPPVDASALAASAVSERFDIAALRAGYDAQEAGVRKAILDQFPTLDLSVNLTRDTTPNTLLGPGIGFTLPLWNRGCGGIAVEQATRTALRAEFDARVAQVRAEIAAGAGALVLAGRQRDDLLLALPALERLAAATTRAAGRGDLAPATASVAVQALRDRQTQLVQVEQDIAEKLIGLELLSGRLRESWAL